MPRRTRTQLIHQKKVRSVEPRPGNSVPQQDRSHDGEHATVWARTAGAL